ncbi:hypothetical protein D3C81_2112310 [compost metagenome]
MVFAIEGIELVDLPGATHLEQGLEGTQVGFAELGDVAGFQGQLDRLSGAQVAAIDAGN